jgi:hypothetical protein
MYDVMMSDLIMVARSVRSEAAIAIAAVFAPLRSLRQMLHLMMVARSVRSGAAIAMSCGLCSFAFFA